MNIALFAIALLFVFVRIVVRYRYQKQLHLDDVFLLVGILCLCASFGLFIYIINYFFKKSHVLFASEPDKILDAWMAMTYTTIFSVKLSFLFFFRILVRRVPKMMFYWWTVLVIMFLAWPVSIVAAVAPSCALFGGLRGMAELLQFRFLIDETDALQA